MDIMDEGFWQKHERQGRTYGSSDAFLEDMREGKLMEGFFLTEDAFQEIVGEVAANTNIAIEVNDHAVLIALAADKGQELGGILELAESFANG